MGLGRLRPSQDDPFERNRLEIAKANAYLLKRVTYCAFLNMTVLSVASPFLSGFAESALLYLISAVLTGLFGAYCSIFLDQHLKAVTPLFYALLAGLCGYAVALSAFFYPDIPGVTIIGIFMFIPMCILDRTWRVNLMFFLYYLISCAFALCNKPYALAVDDCLTSGAFMVFGMLIGSYLRGARLQVIEQKRELEIQRDMDSLTRLPNRRVLFETLARIDREEDGSGVAGIVMIDIDDFKGYNDRNGHQAGDECLRRLGEFFLEFTRETGVAIYRYGGEEFLGLWLDGAPVDLGELARRLVAAVRDCRIEPEGVTVSVGYADRDAIPDLSSERLISMADSALYEAKRQGRDRAVAYAPTEQGDFPLSATLRQRK